MPDNIKGLRLACPKCGRLLFQLSYTGILMAPQVTLFVFCGTCSIMINILDAFPALFHKITNEELLPTTVPYKVQGEDLQCQQQ